MPQPTPNCIEPLIASTVVGTYSDAINTLQFAPCCVDCKVPLLYQCYEGDLYLIFELDMADGTKVKEIKTNSYGLVQGGVGTIRLKEKLVGGQSVQLQVDEYNCKSKSCLVKAKHKMEGCDECEKDEDCNILIENVKIGITNDSRLSILNASVQSNYSNLVYSIDGENWFNTTREIGYIDASRVSYLYAKPSEETYENLGCMAKYGILVGLKDYVAPIIPEKVVGVLNGNPTKLVGKAISDTKVFLNWLDNSNNETGFRIFMSEDNGVTYIAKGETTDDEFTVENLLPSKTYLFKVLALFPSTVSEYTNTVTVATLALGSDPTNPYCATTKIYETYNNGSYTVNYTDKNGVYQTVVTVGIDNFCVCSDNIYAYSEEGSEVTLTQLGSCL